MKVIIFIVCFFSMLITQKNIIQKEIILVDTLYVEKPTLIYLKGAPKYSIVLDLDKIEDLTKLIDTNMIDSSYSRIKRKYHTVLYYHPVRVNPMFIYNKLDYRIKDYNISKLKELSFGDIKIIELNSNYVLLFQLDKKKIYEEIYHNDKMPSDITGKLDCGVIIPISESIP